MINVSRIQLELERAKEGLREVEETIHKVEGKAFPNGPGRYANLKVQLNSDKNRNQFGNDDGKLQKRTIALNSDIRNKRISSDDLSFNLKRGPRDKRDVGLKRQGFDSRPQSITARLSTITHQPAEEEDDEEFTKKLSLPSRVITTAAEAPSRQEIIAAQTGDELVKQRNRRMFGALVGTLQKFRKEETRVREREEKRLKVEKKLEEDAKREKEKLLQEKRELFLERKRREVEIKRIEWSLNRVKEYEAWEANVIPLKNFIRTHAKPHIFYLPSTHNSKTEERLSQSQKIVARMIEKRKNNLKEEIENSEKKARRTAAEEDEEEAENIPQNADNVEMAEQQMDIDFDAINKENGFHEDDSKTQGEEIENTKSVEPGKGNEAWSEVETMVDEMGIADSEMENKTEEQEPIAETIPENDACGSSEVQVTGENKNDGNCDGGGEENKDGGTCDDTGEGRTFDEPEDRSERNESDAVEKLGKESETDKIQIVPVCESETVQPVENPENVKAGETQPEAEEVKNCDPEEKKDEVEKPAEKRKEDSPSRKSKRNYRSPGRRSRSPRRFAKTRRRSRSSSRRRKSYRRRSRSHSKSISPSKRSRKERSPRTRRRSERGSPRRRSSRTRRKSSSKSSGSVSPRKRMKFRSPSSSNSRSDSD